MEWLYLIKCYSLAAFQNCIYLLGFRDLTEANIIFKEPKKVTINNDFYVWFSNNF